ncbi:MAG: Replication protein [uncultured bacterium (gcode 4)]|uniref:Replication protein n=1 Tax=uncultured bacterium (gcode 4) TaxID=1234023 RepID=K1X4M3_9BACT|nr:MAG: Replication protein [uncultured bacterium (gcode 4)]
MPISQDIIQRTIDKMVRSQEKKKEITSYLEANKPHLLGNIRKKGRIRDCCNVLIFRDYASWEQKLYKSNFCKYDKFCLACATRRSIKMIQKFEAWIVQYGLDTKNWYHISLTVKHNNRQSLDFLMDKLWRAKEKLAQRFRNSKRANHKTKSFMNNFDGIVSSVEITYSQKSWWHPHIHMLVCTDKNIHIEYSQKLTTYSNRELQKEWYQITGDSYSVAMRKVEVNKDNYSRKGIGEVFKYAVKFSKLDIPQLSEVIEIQLIKKYRFFATYGIFRGWKIEKSDIMNNDKFIEKTFEYYKDGFEEK